MAAFEIVQDPQSKLVRVIQHGLWTPEIVDAYFRALAPTVHQSRQTGRAIRILSDRRECPVQSVETVKRAGYHAGLLFVLGDKIALVVQTSLVNLQIRREYSESVFNMFLSANAAELWLTAS